MEFSESRMTQARRVRQRSTSVYSAATDSTSWRNRSPVTDRRRRSEATLEPGSGLPTFAEVTGDGDNGRSRRRRQWFCAGGDSVQRRYGTVGRGSGRDGGACRARASSRSVGDATSPADRGDASRRAVHTRAVFEIFGVANRRGGPRSPTVTVHRDARTDLEDGGRLVGTPPYEVRRITLCASPPIALEGVDGQRGHAMIDDGEAWTLAPGCSRWRIRASSR